MSETRVRFAPSPTGYLHVGGARTAIFNWLLARKRGGTFVLRIEDTDRERSSDEMVRAILDGMDWLGLAPDEGPFFQSEARDRHLADARRLLDAGRAYRCFCSQETLRAGRQAAEREGGGYRYPRTCLALDRAESDRRAADGEPFVVRVEVPQHELAWDDAVHGATSFDGAAIEDFVVVRSDGTPTYMLSVVSDDVAMRISDVVRGDDHLSNTPKQIALYRALGAPTPRFAHLPLILGEDKKRLSKRHGAVSVLDYRDRGYLAGAMLNFLSLLGWNPGDGREKLGREELVDAFGFEGVGRSGAVFDLRKLEWLNGQYIDDLEPATLAAAVRPFVEDAGLWTADLGGDHAPWFERVVALLQPRCRTLAAFPEAARPLLDRSDTFDFEAKPARKHLKGGGVADLLRALVARLDALDSWTEETLEEVFRTLAEERGVGAGKLIHPVRLAVTGRGASPGLFEVLALLGRERTRIRIDRVLAGLADGSLPPAPPSA
jgi:glutamyl-tRNA synthetase